MSRTPAVARCPPSTRKLEDSSCIPVGEVPKRHQHLGRSLNWRHDSPQPGLPNDFQRQLNLPRRSLRGGDQPALAIVAPVASKMLLFQGAAKIRAIQHIEKLRTELHIESVPRPS